MIVSQREINGMSSYESKALIQYGLMNDIPIRYYDNINEISQGDLIKAILVEGSVESISEALACLGKSIPEPDYYPASLEQYLHRKVWRSTLADAICESEKRPVFIKSHEWKRLTGTVIHKSNILFDLDDSLDVWCSDPVIFMQEYRVYVRDHKIIGVSRYDEAESDNMRLDMIAIAQAISILKESCPRAAYAFDWGILDSGETALVENNDGWAIGRYAPLDYRTYTEFLMARWQELVA